MSDWDCAGEFEWSVSPHPFSVAVGEKKNEVQCSGSKDKNNCSLLILKFKYYDSKQVLHPLLTKYDEILPAYTEHENKSI